jgi:hypothetical protein
MVSSFRILKTLFSSSLSFKGNWMVLVILFLGQTSTKVEIFGIPDLWNLELSYQASFNGRIIALFLMTKTKA